MESSTKFSFAEKFTMDIAGSKPKTFGAVPES
jgi:hypothetical protein